MNSRVGTAVVVMAILLVASRQVVGSQSSPSLALVDVPIPTYPPIAQSAFGRFTENLQPGMTKEQVRHEMASVKYPHLDFHRESQLVGISPAGVRRISLSI